MSNHKSLVSQHLENIKSDALEKFQDIIKTYVHGRHGIYALYRRNSLYYVGLASNLRNRLRSHLKDRHRKLWDRFSVYLTDDDDHVKELESLILRIVGTKGNMNRGKFGRKSMRLFDVPLCKIVSALRQKQHVCATLPLKKSSWRDV